MQFYRYWQGICITKYKTENFLHQFSSLMVNRERHDWPLLFLWQGYSELAGDTLLGNLQVH